MESADVEPSYSRGLSQQRFGPGHGTIATPTMARVRSVPSQSHGRGACSRSRTRSGSAARWQDLEKDGIGPSEGDGEAQKEDAVSCTPSARPTSRPGTPRTHGSDDYGLRRRRILRFEDDDPDNPNQWPKWKKCYAIFVAIMSVMNSTMNSSLAAGAIEPISNHFNEHDELKLILPTSMYLVGYVCGPMIWGPLSESYGRKGVMQYSFGLLTVFSIASAVAPSFAALVVFRLMVGIGGSCAISVVGGICADVYHDAQARGRSLAMFMAATTFGPILGPLVSGFVGVVSWHWAFWIGALFAGASWPLFLFFPETYGPVLLKHRARRLRRETGLEDVVAPIELEETHLYHIVTVVLSRPLRMICFEPLVLFTCLYLSYAYAIFYIYLQSYPLIFHGLYRFNAGQVGLAFLPIGVGAVIAALLYLAWDAVLERAHRAHRAWADNEEMRRLPLACLAGPFFVISSFWLAWTAQPTTHWLLPALAGILFGMGYLCLFMALLNYLIDAYQVFAASAMAAASLSRSSFGALLPLAAKPMYRALGVPWATSLLGFFSLALCVVPFVFVKCGPRMRRRSPFCQYLRAKQQQESAALDAERRGDREPVGRVGPLEARGEEQV